MSIRRLAWLALTLMAVSAWAVSAMAIDPPPDEATANRSDYLYSPDEAIELFELRTKVNPRDYTSLTTLGDLYEKKARETDDLAFYAKAEAVLRRSLEIFPDSAKTKVALAVVLGDRHKFAESLAMGESVLKASPRSVDALATVGDAQLELGRYDDAEQSFRALVARLPGSGPALARLAHLEELKGKTESSISMFHQAIDSLRKAGETKPGLAWYEVRLADILFNAGRVAEAEAIYVAVLKDVPKQHDATYGLARVRASQNKTAEAIELAKAAVAIGPDAPMLATLGDLFALHGEADRAQAVYNRIETQTSSQPEHTRVLANFYSDYGRNLPRALELARDELIRRQDIYGHDALAWALLKNGHPAEASVAMANALKLGTKDARLFYHVGMIQHALGDQIKARDFLNRALALNPNFSLRDAADARRTLKAIEADATPKAPR